MPSSARVALWRRLRSAGALGLSNGAWVLPARDDHASLLQGLAETAVSQGGHATVFNGQPQQDDNGDLISRFRADRAREYGEFYQRTDAFLEEVEKERRLNKFTFAELEEIEDDFHKLETWLAKIEARDFFPDERQEVARTALKSCENARDAFSQDVYVQEGLEDKDETIS